MSNGDLVTDVNAKRRRPKSKMGKVNLTIDKNQELKIVGAIYGAYTTIEQKNFRASIYLDHYNQRLKILNFKAVNYQNFFSYIEHIAKENNFDKLVCVSKANNVDHFLAHDFVLEAKIQNFFGANQPAFFLAKNLSMQRDHSALWPEEDELVSEVNSSAVLKHPPKKNSKYIYRSAEKKDIPKLLSLYRKVFETYPSPLIHQDYLETIFAKESIFYVAQDISSDEGIIVAAASAEIFPDSKAAEMTDCATLKPHRGNGLMARILWQLESVLKEKDFTCAYTTARARSFGMNLVFHKLGYNYLGRAKNHCDIQGTFEDMNYWSKTL